METVFELNMLFILNTAEAVGQTMHVPIMLHTTAELHCVYHIREERILAAQWYKSSQSDAFVEDEGAVAWWYFGETTGSLQGYSITPDFALVMRNVNITDGGLYRCAITPSGNVADYTYDVNIEVYGKLLLFLLLFLFVIMAFSKFRLFTPSLILQSFLAWKLCEPVLSWSTDGDVSSRQPSPYIEQSY